MRVILAAIATIASIVMLVIGGLQFMDASRETTVTASGATDSNAPLMVVDDSVLASRAGAQLVQVEGDGHISVIIGRTADVQAWVGDAKHVNVSIDEGAKVEDGKLPLTMTETGTESQVPNPVTADQWFERHEAEGSFRLDTVVAPGYSMLIASDGKAPAPSTLSITWPLAGYAPLAGPLLVAGGVFALLAIALWVWAIRHRRAAAKEGARTRTEIQDSELRAMSIDGVPAWSPVPWRDEVENFVTADESITASETAEAAVAEPEVSAPEASGMDALASDSLGAGVIASNSSEPEQTELPASAADAVADEPVLEGAQRDEEHAESGRNAVAEADEQIVAILDEHLPDEQSPFAPDTVTAQEEDVHSESELGDERTDAAAPVSESAPADEAAPASEAEAANEAEQTAETAPVVDTAPVLEPEIETEPDVSTESETEHDAASQAEPPAPAPASDDDESKWRRPRGRNRSSAPKRVFFAPVLVVASLGLAGCAPQYWPANWTNTDVNPQGSPTSSVDAAIIQEDAHPPALNDQQIKTVIADAAEVAAAADKAKDAAKLKARFTGDALALRDAHYKANKANGDNPMPAAFPTGDVLYAMPEASDQWPRTLFVVVAASADSADGAAPSAITMTQANPRENYKVSSLVQLAADVTLPEAAPSSIGSESIANLPEDLVVKPEELAGAYADVIAQGDKSPHAAKFEPKGDVLRESVNDAYRKKESEAIDPQIATLSFEYKPTSSKPAGMVGLDGGAVVTVSIQETETLKAANDRARIKLTGPTADLAGASETSTGFSREYTDQLLFYVPSTTEGGKVQFLGVSQAMTNARQLSAEEVAQ